MTNYLERLTAQCSRREYCLHDIRQKLRRWEVPEEEWDKIIRFLVDERYVDEERYARSFIRSKKEYNRWGEYKIRQGLRVKGISEDVYAPLLKEFEGDDYEETLRQLLQRKAPTVKANNDYERNQKLIRFALQRGFSYDLIAKVLGL